MLSLARSRYTLALVVLAAAAGGTVADEPLERDAAGVPILRVPQGTLDGHRRSINCLVFAPDGKTLVSSAADTVVRIWNVATGAVVKELPTGRHMMWQLAYAADGRLLAGLAPAGRAYLWDMPGGTTRAVFDVDSNAYALALSPDGKQLAVGSEAGTISLWEVSRPNIRYILKGPGKGIRALVFSGDGKRLAVGDWDGRCQVIDVDSGLVLLRRDFGAHIVGLSFKTRGGPLAVGRKDGKMLLGNLETGRARPVLRGYTPRVFDVAFSPGGGLLAVAGYDTRPPSPAALASLLDLGSGRVRAVLRGRGPSSTAVAFAPDGRILATGAEDGSIQLWTTPLWLARASGFEDTGVPIFDKPLSLCRGHKGAVNSAAFSADGLLLASGGEDGSVHVWDPATGLARHKLLPAGKPAPVFMVRFAGRALAALHTDGQVVLWDPTTGKALGTVRHPGDAYVLAVTRDGKTLAVGGDDGRISVWDWQSWRRTAILHSRDALITALGFSADGTRLVAGDRNGRAIVWDLAQDKVLQRVLLPSRPRAFAFPDADRTLAVCSPDKIITLNNLQTGLSQSVLSGHRLVVSDTAFNPDATLLAIAGWSSRKAGRQAVVRLWEVAYRRERAVLRPRGTSAEAVVFAPDGRTVATGSDDGSVQVWDVPGAVEAPPGPRALAVVKRETDKGMLHVLAYSPDGRLLASGGANKAITLRDAATLAVRDTLTGHTHGVRALAFAPDGKTLASGGGRTVRVWDLTAKKTIHILEGHTGVVVSVAFAPDGKTLAVGLSDGRVFVWDAATGKRQVVLTGHKGPVYGVAITLDGKTVVSASSEGGVKLWDVARAVEVATLPHAGRLRTLALSRDGRLLALGGPDGVLELWDLPKRRQLSVQPGAGKLVWAVAFAPDGGALASASLEEGVRVWRLGLWGLRLAAYTPPGEGQVRCLAFTPDGTQLATGGDGAITTWALRPRK